MTNPILDAKQECREIVLAALGRCVAEGELPAEPIPDFTVEIPGDISHGDFATNIAMVSARVFRKAPRQIAEALTAQMVLLGTSFDAVEVAGAGFINFTLGRRTTLPVRRGGPGSRRKVSRPGTGRLFH